MCSTSLITATAYTLYKNNCKRPNNTVKIIGGFHQTYLHMYEQTEIYTAYTATAGEGKIKMEDNDELVLERRNSRAFAMELRLSCINPSIYSMPIPVADLWQND